MSLEKAKILAIDDEEDFCFFVKRNLERLGSEVITATGGEEGFKLARKHKPDLILLDIMMPGIDGFEVLKKLKEDTETIAIPIIMLTGKDDDDSKIKAAGLYDEDYIVKPVEVDALRSRIEEALTRRGK